MTNERTPLERALNRRAALRLLGAAGVGGAVLAQSDPFRLLRTTTSVRADTLDCTVKPALTEGPYFVDERLNRTDIRTDPSTGAAKPGVPLKITFNVSRIDGSCTPISGVTVDVWHCDALGKYGDISSEGTSGQMYLRGYQVTDANGKVSFTTIYPGWYSGRAVHLHFKMRVFAGSSTTYELTSQFFFNPSTTAAVVTQSPYNTHGSPTTSNAQDGIYQQSGGQTLLTVVSDGNGGYTASFNIGLSGIPSTIAGADTSGIYIASTGAYFLKNSNGSGPADLAFIFGGGGAGLTPLRGDWNGDGVDAPGLYVASTGTFFLKNTNASGPADLTFTFGAANAGYRPITGDWNGDGLDSVGLYSPATGAFFLENTNASGSADTVFTFGPAGGSFVPIAGDWDGNGKSSIGLYDPTTAAFFLRNSNSGGVADVTFIYGPPNATPVAGDWDNNGQDSVGIYVPSTGSWFLRNSTTPGPGDVVYVYGPSGAVPIVGDWDGAQ